MTARSRMCVCIIRTGGRSTTRPDAAAKQPRLQMAARPHPATGTMGLALGGGVLAFRILRPIQRETFAQKPFSDIGTADGTGCYSPPILIFGDRRTIDRPPRDESVEIVGCLRATLIQVAVCIAAELAALRCIAAPEPDARPMNFQRVAVDDAGLAN